MRNDIERMVHDYDGGHLTRRQLIAGITGLAAAWGAVPRALGQEDGETPTFVGTDVNHIALRVTDIPRSRDREAIRGHHAVDT